MKNDVKVRISGFNLNRIIDYLISKNVLILELKISKKSMTFILSKKDLGWLDKICKFEHKRYVVIHRYVIVNLIKNIPNYLGFLLAVIIVAAYVYSFNSRIFKINLINASEIEFDLNRIDSFLKENGVCVGSNKHLLRSYYLERKIINNVDGVSGCLIDFVGGVLNISVYPEIEREDVNVSNLYSKFDAVITELNVFSGNSGFVVGDVVKVGDLIIESDNGANGNVKGKVFFSSTKIYNQKKQNKVFTGNYKVFRNVGLFNINLIKCKKQYNYSNYLEKKCDFYLTDKYLVPIKVSEIYCFEYDIVEEFVEFEKVENEVKESLYNEVMLKVPQNAKVENCTYSVVKEGDLVRIDCFIETIVDLV